MTTLNFTNFGIATNAIIALYNLLYSCENGWISVAGNMCMLIMMNVAIQYRVNIHSYEECQRELEDFRKEAILAMDELEDLLEKQLIDEWTYCVKSKALAVAWNRMDMLEQKIATRMLL